MVNKNIKVIVLFACLFFSFYLSGCEKRKPEPDTTTFELNTDGTVLQTIKGNAGNDTELEDLQAYVTELIAAYCGPTEYPSIVLEDIRLSGGSATIQILYASVEDYAAFNHVDAFNGTVAKAYLSGYTFDRTLKNVAGFSRPGFTVPVEYPGLRVLVLKEAMNVNLPVEPILISEDITIQESGSLTIGKAGKPNVPEIFQTVNENCSYIVYKAPESEENK